MRKQTITLVTCIAVFMLGMLTPAPVNSLFGDECYDCYFFELTNPDGTVNPNCLACLSLTGSTAMGCYQVGVCGCLEIWPDQCSNC